jgi:squalene synthase HpnC
LFSSAELQDLATPTGGQFQVATLQAAHQFCARLAKVHYENFPVGSLLVPKHLQPYVYSVYAFARVADDIADEYDCTPDERLYALAAMEALLTGTTSNQGNPVFVALADTMQACAIPPEPLQRLLEAFRMDSTFTAPRTMEEVFFYCERSANPVGELVLRIFGLWNAERRVCSDAICTALQLANFWQDIAPDKAKGRFFVPATWLERHRLDAERLLQAERLHDKETERLEGCVQELCQFTIHLFTEGAQLLPMLPSLRLRAEIALTIAGGTQIVRRTAALGNNILFTRPALGTKDALSIARHWIGLMAASFLGRNSART